MAEWLYNCQVKYIEYISECPEITVTVSGMGEGRAVTFSIGKLPGSDLLRPIFPSLSLPRAPSPPPHARTWMACKALTTTAAWRHGGTEVLCVCVRAKACSEG